MIWRERNKSSIIHQINKENKKAYRERIIERNRKAKEQQAKDDELQKQNDAKNTKKPTKPKKAAKEKSNTKLVKTAVIDNSKVIDGEFDDIMKASNNPSRVQGYSKEPLKMSRKEMYVSNGETLDSKIVSADKKADLHPIKENSKEQNEEIVDKDKGNYSFLNREISDDSSEENDLNNRVDWKMESPNKIIRPVTDQEKKKTINLI
jgi:hypothetical protein